MNKVLLLYGSEHKREEEISFNFQCQLNSLGVLVHRLGLLAGTKTKVITSSTKGCNALVIVYSKESVRNKTLTEIYSSLLQKGVLVTVLIPRDQKLQNNVKGKLCTPKYLPPPLRELEVFQEKEFFYEEDQEVRRFLMYVESGGK